MPACFMKLSIFVWACKSQGVEVDLDAFLRLHEIHYQSRKVPIGEGTASCQFACYTLYYKTRAVIPVQAQKNKLPALWLKTLVLL